MMNEGSEQSFIAQEWAPPTEPTDEAKLAPNLEPGGTENDDLAAVIAGTKQAALVSPFQENMVGHITRRALLDKVESGVYRYQDGQHVKLELRNLENGAIALGTPDRLDDIEKGLEIFSSDPEDRKERENLIGHALGYPQYEINAHIASLIAEDRAMAEGFGSEEIRNFGQKAYEETLAQGKAAFEKAQEDKPAVRPNIESEEARINNALYQIERSIFPELVNQKERSGELAPDKFLQETVLKQLVFTVANRYIKQRGETSLEGFEDQYDRTEAINKAISRLTTAAIIIESRRSNNTGKIPENTDQSEYSLLISELNYAKALTEPKYLLPHFAPIKDKRFITEHLNELNIATTAHYVDNQRKAEGRDIPLYVPNHDKGDLENFIAGLDRLGFKSTPEGLVVPTGSSDEQQEKFENKYLSAFEPYRDLFLAVDEKHRDKMNLKVETEIGRLEGALSEFTSAEISIGNEAKIVDGAKEAATTLSGLEQELRKAKSDLPYAEEAAKSAGIFSRGKRNRELAELNDRIGSLTSQIETVQKLHSAASEQINQLGEAKTKHADLNRLHGSPDNLKRQLEETKRKPKY